MPYCKALQTRDNLERHRAERTSATPRLVTLAIG
jgi:hypothetical protein